MKILGVTGSIGMGKSTVCRMLREMGVPVHDADAAVHRLMGPGGRATPRIEALFPGVTGPDGGIDRRRLGPRVLGDDAALKRLEGVLHPLVRRAEAAFLRRCRLHRVPIVALDIPLLYETGGERRCDAVLVVSAPPFLQRQRVLSRPGMTDETFARILSRQMPDAEKRKRADMVIPSGLGLAVTRRRLRRALKTLKEGDSHA